LAGSVVFASLRLRPGKRAPPAPALLVAPSLTGFQFLAEPYSLVQSASLMVGAPKGLWWPSCLVAGGWLLLLVPYLLSCGLLRSVQASRALTIPRPGVGLGGSVALLPPTLLLCHTNLKIVQYLTIVYNLVCTNNVQRLHSRHSVTGGLGHNQKLLHLAVDVGQAPALHCTLVVSQNCPW